MVKLEVEVNVAEVLQVQGSSLVVLFSGALFASQRSPSCKPATKLPRCPVSVWGLGGEWGRGGELGEGVKARLRE